LQPIELGVDDDGDPVQSCVVIPTLVDHDLGGDQFQRAVARLPAGPRLIFNQLAESLDQSGEPIPTGIPDTEINRFRVGKVVKLAAWRDKAISASGVSNVPANPVSGTGRDKNRDATKKAFNRALPKLQNAGIIRVWEEWAWITHELPK
jgi:hypothetical protein